MSIADKITSIENHLKDDYQSIANLGADLTNVDKNIENISSLLDGVYDVLPKTSFQEGTDVTIENGLKGKIDFDEGKVGFGQSSQVSTQGYNLANLNGMNDTTNNGITFTINKENGLTKSVKINGTSVNYDSYCVGTAYLLKAGTYTVYGNGITDDIILQIVNDTQSSQLGYAGKNDNTMTLSQDTNVIIRLRVAVGKTINNVEVKPIIATTSGKTFEPYTGGYASPSPNWEQEVKCVAGRNKADYSSTYTSGNLSNLGAFNLTLNNSIDIDIHKEYYFSADIKRLTGSGTTTMNVIRSGNNSGQTCVAVTRPNMTSDFQRYVFKCTYTQAQTLTQVAFQVLTDNSVTIEVKNIMVATEDAPYLPYNTIQETIRGKNELEGIELGDIDPQGGMPFSSDSSFRSINYIPYDTSKTYYVSVNSVLPTSQGLNLRFFNKSKEYIGYSTLTGSGSNFTITKGNQVTTTDLEPKYFKFRQTLSAGPITSLNDKVMIATISGATYEPYVTPRTYQFSLGGHKLYDECYIVGSPDNWKIVSNWYRLTSAELTNLTIGASGSVGKKFVVVKSSFVGVPSPKVGKIYCTHLRYYSTAWYADGYCGIVSPGATLWMQMTQAFESIDAFKTFITTNNMEFVYQTEEPIETPITDETLITQLNNWYYSQSFSGTTILESNGDLPMIIKVRALKGE